MKFSRSLIISDSDMVIAALGGKMKFGKSLVISGMVIAALILSAVVLMGAGEGGAVTLQSPKAVLTGAVSYTVFYTMPGVYVGGYGSTQWQIGIVVTDAQMTTATVQFSNQVVDCASATAWADTVKVLDAAGSTPATLSSTLMLSGTVSMIYELPNFGRCARVLLSSDNTYTPSVYIRMLNSFK